MRKTTIASVLACCGVLALSACSSNFSSSKEAAQGSGKGQKLTVMIASSGTAETTAVKAATAAWAKQTGNSVSVIPASNMDQQLGQGLASGNPPDVFYVSSNQFANYAKGGSLYPYVSQISDASDFSPALLKTFSYQGKEICLPKDTSTLGLVINTALWKQAGLTPADYPKNWTQLESDAKRLTSKTVTGLSVNPDYNQLGAFMKGAGGWITNADQTKITADSPQNLQALQYVQKLLKSGVMKFPKQLGAGWGGEAFGKGKAAMTIEGNWIDGAMKTDYPSVKYQVVPLPVGPTGQNATLSFSNCWGVAQKSAHRSAAVDLVKYLSSANQQMTFAKAFGVMPSRLSALATYKTEFPNDAAFVSGVPYAQGPVTLPNFAQQLTQFISDLGTLPGADPKKILADLQTNGTQALTSQG